MPAQSRASSPYLARGLRAIIEDTAALGATIDQGQGSEPLAPGVTRRGFSDAMAWLPGIDEPSESGAVDLDHEEASPPS